MTAPPSQPIMLSARNVACAHGGTRVVDGVDLDLVGGQITVILGASGAGKSTLLRAIAGFEPVVEGSLSTGDVELSRQGVTTPPEQRDIGIVVQNFALFPHLTVARNIAFGLPASGDMARVMALLETIGLPNRGDAYPHELSGGEQQRVALARALAREPSVVLLDEAFSSLDPGLRRALRAETQAMLRASGAAVLAVTHDAEEAMMLADHLLVMDAGRIIARGAPSQLYWLAENTVAARLLGEVNEWHGRCTDGAVMTAFGTFAAHGLPDGATAHALVRPEAITLTTAADSPLTVTHSQFLGAHSQLTISAPSGDTALVRMASDRAPDIGARVTLSVPPTRARFIADERAR